MSYILGPVIPVNFVDKRLAATPTAASPLGTPANYASEAALDARLATINGAYFTASMLRIMNTNDKVYALRLADDSAGI